MRFDRAELRAKVDETLVVRLDNHDRYPHQFDLDALNIHASMPTGQSILAYFTPTRAGTYTFYCALHFDNATGHGMIGTLIVAP